MIFCVEWSRLYALSPAFWKDVTEVRNHPTKECICVTDCYSETIFLSLLLTVKTNLFEFTKFVFAHVVAAPKNHLFIASGAVLNGG